jgi:hypothetical protein
MFRLDSVLQLKEREEIRMVARGHVATVIPKLFLALLLIVVPFFFLFPLFASGPTGIVAFLALVIAGAITAWRAFAMWDGNVLVISNLRVIKVSQTGIFSRTVKEISSESVKDFSWEKKGLFGHLFNYGNVAIGNDQEIRFRHISRPQSVYVLVQEIADTAKKHTEAGMKEPGKEAVVARLESMIENMEEEKLRKLERTIKHEEREEAIGELFRDDEPKEGTKGEDEEDVPIKKLFGSNEETNKLKPLDDEH